MQPDLAKISVLNYKFAHFLCMASILFHSTTKPRRSALLLVYISAIVHVTGQAMVMRVTLFLLIPLFVEIISSCFPFYKPTGKSKEIFVGEIKYVIPKCLYKQVNVHAPMKQHSNGIL